MPADVGCSDEQAGTTVGHPMVGETGQASHTEIRTRSVERRAFSVQAMHPIKDKRARLRVAARYIKTGVVKFPRTGCEQLLAQLLGFGAEKHDDAVDALVYLILGLVGEGISPQDIHYV